MYIKEEETTQWTKKKYKRTKNDLQNMHIKLKIGEDSWTFQKMYGLRKVKLIIKGKFSGSLECPLYTGLTLYFRR
jgi:hypothetical protein